MAANTNNIEEIISEQDALKVLKLKEEVFHPNLSKYRHWRSIMQIFSGIIMMFGTMIPSHPISSQFLIYGNMFIVFGLLTMQQKNTKELHTRIDKLIELQELSQISKK